MDNIFAKNGTQHIQELINEGVRNGTRTATVTGAWEIESAVLIPSDFTIILENCHLRMADDTFDNMFRNENCGDVIARKSGGENKNITIKGVGEAILDGGNYNGLSERNAGKDGRPPMYVNNLLLFVNVDGFEIRDIHCRNQRWWALCFIYCSNGLLTDIDFCSNDTAIDENGNEYHYLLHEKGHSEILVQNADGIDLRHGCHDIKIHNITGFTEDDTIALTGLIGKAKTIAFETPHKPLDICNVEILNVRSAAHCSNVRLLSQGGVPLHDIYIDGVYDMSAESEHMDVGGHGVRVGDGHVMYGWRHATEDEVYNITVKNVHSRARGAAVHLGDRMKNLVLENIEAFDGAIQIKDMREKD